MFKLNQFQYQIDEFLNFCTAKDLSKKTLKSYEQTLRLLGNYLKQNYKVEEAENTKEIMLVNYINYLKERGKYTTVTDEKSKVFNHPDKRADYGKKVSTTTINNYM